MKAAILCNRINWTINYKKQKHYLQHVENKIPYEWKSAE